MADADPLGSKHEGREAHDRHIRCNAVVVGWITLRDRERFASTLGRTDEVIEPRPLTIQAFYEYHRRIVSFLELGCCAVIG